MGTQYPMEGRPPLQGDEDGFENFSKIGRSEDEEKTRNARGAKKGKPLERSEFQDP